MCLLFAFDIYVTTTVPCADPGFCSSCMGCAVLWLTLSKGGCRR